MMVLSVKKGNECQLLKTVTTVKDNEVWEHSQNVPFLHINTHYTGLQGPGEREDGGHIGQGANPLQETISHTYTLQTIYTCRSACNTTPCKLYTQHRGKC